MVVIPSITHGTCGWLAFNSFPRLQNDSRPVLAHELQVENWSRVANHSYSLRPQNAKCPILTGSVHLVDLSFRSLTKRLTRSCEAALAASHTAQPFLVPRTRASAFQFSHQHWHKRKQGIKTLFSFALCRGRELNSRP